MLGVGTVMTADQARAAIDAGARFLVTPACAPRSPRSRPPVSVPVFLGAFTPTGVAQAVDLGSAAVKIFPAGSVGPYLSDLRGPYPAVELLPSGGVQRGNARSYLDAGALLRVRRNRRRLTGPCRRRKLGRNHRPGTQFRRRAVPLKPAAPPSPVPEDP